MTAVDNGNRLAGEKRPFRLGRRLGKFLLFLVSLLIFIQAIMLMKTGALAIVPLLPQETAVFNLTSGLGFGWLAAYLLLSGSPVAAAALTFLDAGLFSPATTLAMITGSRLGASFLVLLIGFGYVLRGHDRATSLSMGLLSFMVTATTCLVSLGLGLGLLQTDWLPQLAVVNSGGQLAWVDLVFMPLVVFVQGFLPDSLLFLLGIGLILVSFHLFDRSVPQMTIKESQVGQVSRLVYRPWVMLLLGAAVTLVSMSVTLSLSLLVPLSNRGFVRRENVIPYIMGANITTFVDTLFAALLLETAIPVTVVWAQIISIILVSAIILASFYRLYESTMLSWVAWTTANNRNLAWFMVVILFLPMILLLL